MNDRRLLIYKVFRKFKYAEKPGMGGGRFISKVFYESWQMDCCGEPFKVGDTVNWTVGKYEKLGPCNTVNLGKIDYYYENHLFDRGPYFELEGRVIGIKILFEKFGPSKLKPSESVPVSGVLRETTKVERYEKGFNGMRVTGFVVTLSEIVIQE